MNRGGSESDKEQQKKPLKRKTKKLITPVNIGTDHIQGSIDAPINIVEYGDYECPYTGMAYPIVKEIMKQFNNKVYFLVGKPKLDFILNFA